MTIDCWLIEAFWPPSDHEASGQLMYMAVPRDEFGGRSPRRWVQKPSDATRFPVEGDETELILACIERGGIVDGCLEASVVEYNADTDDVASQVFMGRAADVLPPYRTPPQDWRTGYVYVAQSGVGGELKVGWSRVPRERITTLQTGNPKDVSFLYTWPANPSLERKIHRELKFYRVRGEWFRPAQYVLDFLGYIDHFIGDVDEVAA